MNGWSEFSVVFEKLPTSMMIFGLAVLALICGKLIYRSSAGEKNGTGIAGFLYGNDLAQSIPFCGYVIALGIALNCGVKMEGSQWTPLTFFIGFLSSVFLLQLSKSINSFVLLSGIENAKDNIAFKIVEGGCFIATGFMLRGVLMSNSASFWDKVIDIFAYWFIGQVLLSLGGLLFKKMSDADEKTCIQNGNISVALMFAGFLISYGMIIEAALTGATSNIIGELPAIVIFSTVGLMLIMVVQQVADYFLSETDEKLTQNGLFIASLLVSLGFIYAGVIDSSITPETIAVQPNPIIEIKPADFNEIINERSIAKNGEKDGQK